MKKLFFLGFLALSLNANAQSNANIVFAAGLDDANRFFNDYVSPVSEGMLHNLAGGWFNSADAKPLGGFEISVIGNVALTNDDKKSFILNTEDYENLQFNDGSVFNSVSTGLGDIEGVLVYVEGEIAPGVSERSDFELPTGLASENINFVPSAFLQVSVGLIKGTEIKARFLPNIKTDEASIGMFGLGLQHDFTKLLPADKIWPVAVSGIIGYTHLNGNYDFRGTDVIAGENQEMDVEMDTWLFQAVVSTKLPVINVYGGVGYMTGKSKIDLLGTYSVRQGPFQQTYEDPFSVNTKTSGVRGNVGLKLKLGFFRLNADYTMAEFNSLSLGLNFGFR